MTVPDNTDVQTRVLELHPDLKSWDHLVGIWTVSGDATGTIKYEWTEGRFFLVQHANKAERDAHINSGMESGLQTSLDLLEQVAISLG
jgi:hypothetical protein